MFVQFQKFFSVDFIQVAISSKLREGHTLKFLPPRIHFSAGVPSKNWVKKLMNNKNIKLSRRSQKLKVATTSVHVREGVHKKNFLNRHRPFKGGGSRPLPGWFGPFFYEVIVLKRGIF